MDCVYICECHLLVTDNYEVSANINEFEIESSENEKLLGISIDTALSFEHHITSLCKKASQKLYALARIAHYMDFEKPISLMKAFVISQFNYYPLIWMFHNRALNNGINKIHQRALRLVYQNKNLSFSELLELDNAVTIHQRNLQVLVTEIFKIKNNLSAEIMKQGFDFQEPYYNLRSETSQFRRENIKITHYGIQYVKFLGPKIWAMVPQNIKNCKYLQEFKKLIQVWKLKACPCRICKKYVANIGFI